MSDRHVVTVDDVDARLPDVVRQRLAADLADPSTVEGTQLSATIAAGVAPKVDRAYQATPNAFSSAKALISRGFSAVLGIGSDSTGAGVTRWPYLFASWLAAQNPACTVVWRPFNPNTLKWDPRTTIQTGAAGVRRVVLDGTTLTGLVEGSTGTAFSNITGDLDLRAKLAPTLWTGAAAVQTIISKFGGGGQRAYRFQVQPNGKLSFDWTADGSTIQALFASTVAVPFANGAVGWVRLTFQPNSAGNTVATFYTSTDGYAWTILGTAQTRAGTTSIFSTTTQPCEIGSRGGGQAEMLGGALYEIEVRNGIDGAIACPTRPELWSPANSNYNGQLLGAPVIDLWDGAWSGGILSANLIPNQALMVPAVGMSAFIVSASHNETGIAGPLFGQYDTFVNYARSTNPAAGILISTQNPKYTPALQLSIDSQARRCSMLGGYAAQRGYTLIPAYTAFMTSDTPLSQLIGPDGIHPSDAAGSPLWASVVEAVYSAAM